MLSSLIQIKIRLDKPDLFRTELAFPFNRKETTTTTTSEDYVQTRRNNS